MGQKKVIRTLFYFTVCERSGCPVHTIAGLGTFQCFYLTFDVNLSVECCKCWSALS